MVQPAQVNLNQGPFWDRMAPCEHLVQFYRDEEVLLNALEGYIAGGLRAGDAVVVIANPAHRRELDRRLESRGLDAGAARARDQYIPVDARWAMGRFLVEGMPDARRFEALIDELLARARSRQWNHTVRRVRAFGEMVAILWEQGNTQAALRLEELWHRQCAEKAFSLFCAYPRGLFQAGGAQALQPICDRHDTVIID